MDGIHIVFSDTKVQIQRLRTAHACGTGGDGVRSYVRRMRARERQNTVRIPCGWDIQGGIHVEEMDWPELYRKFLFWHDGEVLHRNVGKERSQAEGKTYLWTWDMVDTCGEENNYILPIDTFFALAPTQDRIFGILSSLGNISPRWPYALIIIRIAHDPECLGGKSGPFRNPRICLTQQLDARTTHGKGISNRFTACIVAFLFVDNRPPD